MSLVALLALSLSALLIALTLLGLRRRNLRVRGGIDCSWRHDRGGWQRGVLLYDRDVAHWYRTFSFSPRAAKALPRDITVTARRKAQGAEVLTVGSNTVVLECSAAHERYGIALDLRASWGLRAWSESVPPGRDVHVVV